MNGKHHTDHQAEYKWFANETVQGGKLWPAWNGDPLTPGYPAMGEIFFLLIMKGQVKGNNELLISSAGAKDMK